MGLRETILSGVDAVFNAAGNIKEEINYHRKYNPVHTPGVGTTDNPANVDIDDIEVVLVNYKSREIDGQNILRNDMRVLVKGADLNGLRPAVNDVVERKSIGEDWVVKDFGTDPIEAHWDLQIRRA